MCQYTKYLNPPPPPPPSSSSSSSSRLDCPVWALGFLKCFFHPSLFNARLFQFLSPELWRTGDVTTKADGTPCGLVEVPELTPYYTMLSSNRRRQ
jgi:hypothetical protein